MPPPRAASSDAIRRQVRRCRWRRNLVTVQTVALGTAAVLLTTATVLLVAALVVEPATFAVTLVASAVVVAVVEVRLVASAVRAWVRRSAGAAWVDRTAGLGGFLTTLLALDGRPALLLPVLQAENERRRPAWQPERLVPTPFPVLALAAALCASAAFVAALSLAPSLEPRRPDLVDAPGGGRASTPGGLERLARRLFGGGLEDPVGEGRAGADGVGASAGGSARGSGFDRLPASLQARIRRRLWGDRWGERERRMASRAGEGARATAGRREHGGAPGGAGAVAANGDDAPGAAPDDEERAPASGAGAAGSGAGTGSDPDLFGDLARSDDAAGGRFALGLEARVFGGQAGPRRPSGAPVPSDEDEHPELAARSRAAEPFHTMAVPAAYAPIVRAVFTHRATGDTPP